MEYQSGIMKQYPKKFLNLYDSLAQSAQRFPMKTAVIGDKESISYSKLIDRIDRLSLYLQKECGIDSGERVGLLFVNSVDFYVAFYAVIKIGGIAVMVNTKMQSEEIRFVLADTQTKVLVMNNRWYSKIEPLIKDLDIRRIVFEEQPESLLPDVLFTDRRQLEEWFGKEKRIIPGPLREEYMPVAIMHTSGTTGKPKGVVLTHQNILEAAYGYEEVQGVNDTDVTVVSVPLFHILGLSCVSTLFLYIGGTIVVSERLDIEGIIRLMQVHKATHFHSVPVVYKRILKESREDTKFPFLRMAVCGGAPVDKETVDQFCELAPQVSFRFAYGMTETAGSGVLSRVHRGCNQAVPNAQLLVIDPEGNVTGEGEGVFVGPIVTTQIWGVEGAGDALLHSGDIVRKDKDGSIQVLDRIKDMVNRGGEKIFPSIIEEVLESYEGVEQAVVFAISDEEFGEVPAAILISHEELLDVEGIQHDLKNRIARYTIPVYMEIWKREEIPLTGNGKIKKKCLREIFEAKYMKCERKAL